MTSRGAATSLPTLGGRERAGLVDALYLRLFVMALGGMQIVCVMLIIAAVARSSHANFARTAVLAVAVALLASVALHNHVRCYRAMRRWPVLSLVGPAVLLGALVIDEVRHSPLSYATAVSIGYPAFVCGRRWALAAAALVSVGAVAAAWASEGPSALNAVGQGTIGYFVWALVLAGLADSFAKVVVRLPHDVPATPATPRKVPNLAGGPTPSDTAAGGRGVAPDGAAPESMGAADPRSALAGLTARQLQVVALLADGLRAEEISEQLGIATSTVYRTVQRAKTRAGVNSRSDLVAAAIREGLVWQSEGRASATPHVSEP